MKIQHIANGFFVGLRPVNYTCMCRLRGSSSLCNASTMPVEGSVVVHRQCHHAVCVSMQLRYTLRLMLATEKSLLPAVLPHRMLAGTPYSRMRCSRLLLCQWSPAQEPQASSDLREMAGWLTKNVPYLKERRGFFFELSRPHMFESHSSASSTKLILHPAANLDSKTLQWVFLARLDLTLCLQLYKAWSALSELRGMRQQSHFHISEL